MCVDGKYKACLLEWYLIGLRCGRKLCKSSIYHSDHILGCGKQFIQSCRIKSSRASASVQNGKIHGLCSQYVSVWLASGWVGVSRQFWLMEASMDVIRTIESHSCPRSLWAQVYRRNMEIYYLWAESRPVWSVVWYICVYEYYALFPPSNGLIRKDQTVVHSGSHIALVFPPQYWTVYSLTAPSVLIR